MLYYVELEKYESRYTLQLTKWNTLTFDRLHIPYVVVGSSLTHASGIGVGDVLDVYSRSVHTMEQVRWLLGALSRGSLKSADIIYFEDMFHPGIEALFYALAFSKQQPRIVMRCLAQTVDPDDFVYRTGMYPWMRHYEHMVDNAVDALCCHSEEMVANMRVAGWKSDVIVTGLPFDGDEVRTHVGRRSWDAREDRVVFASRFDDEKQPLFFLQLAAGWRVKYPEKPVEFVFLSGREELLSNNPEVVTQMHKAEHAGYVKILLNLKKDDYYAQLASSKVMFNCALQDWVSNTVCEADALGCNVVFPAYRSFPETFAFDHTRLYVPWSLEDAVDKLNVALTAPSPQMGRIDRYQSLTVHRTMHALGLTMKAPPCEPATLHDAYDSSYRGHSARRKF